MTCHRFQGRDLSRPDTLKTFGMRVTSHALKSGDKSPHSIAGFARSLRQGVVLADRLSAIDVWTLALQGWKTRLQPACSQPMVYRNAIRMATGLIKRMNMPQIAASVSTCTGELCEGSSRKPASRLTKCTSPKFSEP